VVEWGRFRGGWAVVAGVCFVISCFLIVYVFLLFVGCWFEQPYSNLTSVGKIVLFAGIDAFLV
jgi:hypothetical protein